jgi:hypothetical protein
MLDAQASATMVVVTQNFASGCLQNLAEWAGLALVLLYNRGLTAEDAT